MLFRSREVLLSAKQKGLLLSVVSSSHEKLIHSVLKKLEISTFFDLLVSAEHLAFGKPHPMPYLEAAKRLCVDNTECVAFEDSPNGVRSALAAGMRVVAIPDREQRNNPIFASAHITLNSLAEWTHTNWNILY